MVKITTVEAEGIYPIDRWVKSIGYYDGIILIKTDGDNDGMKPIVYKVKDDDIDGLFDIIYKHTRGREQINWRIGFLDPDVDIEIYRYNRRGVFSIDYRNILDSGVVLELHEHCNSYIKAVRRVKELINTKFTIKKIDENGQERKWKGD